MICRHPPPPTEQTWGAEGRWGVAQASATGCWAWHLTHRGPGDRFDFVLRATEATSRLLAKVCGNGFAFGKLALAAVGRGNWRGQHCTPLYRVKPWQSSV